MLVATSEGTHSQMGLVDGQRARGCAGREAKDAGGRPVNAGGAAHQPPRCCSQSRPAATKHHAGQRSERAGRSTRFTGTLTLKRASSSGGSSSVLAANCSQCESLVVFSSKQPPVLRKSQAGQCRRLPNACTPCCVRLQHRGSQRQHSYAVRNSPLALGVRRQVRHLVHRSLDQLTGGIRAAPDAAGTRVGGHRKRHALSSVEGGDVTGSVWCRLNRWHCLPAHSDTRWAAFSRSNTIRICFELLLGQLLAN